MADGNGTPQTQTSRPDTRLTKRLLRALHSLWRLFRSLRLAVIMMGLLALACIAGTLIEQEPYDACKAITKYGFRMGLLIGLLGLSHAYVTWWFLTLLGLLAANIAACAIPRMRLSIRGFGFAAAHLSLLFILAGAMVHSRWGYRGRLTIAEGEVAESFHISQKEKISLGLKLRLDDFEIEYYEEKDAEIVQVRMPGEGEALSIPVEVGKVVPLGSDGSTLQVIQRLPHFMRDGDRVYSASSKLENPAIEVKLSGPIGDSTRWVFAKFPGFSMFEGDKPKVDLFYRCRPARIKAYKSHVTVMDAEGKPIKKETIMVNSPIRVGRYTLYQSSYDPKTETTSVLEVLYDPGVPLVFIGFVLMPVGMAFTLYVRPLLNRRNRKHV